MTSDFRWCHLPVSALNLAVPLTVSPNMTIHEVLELLHKEGYDQVPVIDDTGSVQFPVSPLVVTPLSV